MRSIRVVLLVLLAYGMITVAYYHLPWSVRKTLYYRVPSLDRKLMGRGFSIMQGWDDLALIGRDVSVPLTDSFRDDQVYGGWPVLDDSAQHSVMLLRNRGYSVGYSDSMKNPLWVSYRIFNVPELHAGRRPSRFQVDDRTRSRVEHADYTHSGFDRGHMAPNYGIASRYGAEAQRETFLMSNIIPQTPRINRYVWRDLEIRVARWYGRCFGEVWVVTGPVFGASIPTLESGVPIPSAYYKIVVDEHHGELRALAFMVERDRPPYTRIRSCLTSIDTIEAATGIDFFPDLPDEIEVSLESGRATRLWPTLGASWSYRVHGRTD